MDDRTGRVSLVDAVGGVWTALSTLAAIATTALVALFVVGLEAGATAAGATNPLLQSPLHQATRVDEQLLATDPVGLADRALAMAWPLVEAPLLAGMEIGLAAPVVGHVVFYGALLGLLATATATVAGVAFRPIGRWINGGDDGA